MRQTTEYTSAHLSRIVTTYEVQRLWGLQKQYLKQTNEVEEVPHLPD